MSTTLLLEHMHKKFEIKRTQIKGGYQSGRKVVTHNSKSNLPLEFLTIFFIYETLATNVTGEWFLSMIHKLVYFKVV